MEEIARFLLVSGKGLGFGFDDGDGYGKGYGSGSGSSYGKGYGDGYGNGYGNGYGKGYGEGYGSGYGSDDGSGSGHGSGDGSGDGSGITKINGKRVYQIDGIPTLIDSVHGNYAKGRILNDDFTFTPTFIAKVGNYFAHGETLREAMADVQEKYNENSPLSERIAEFKKEFPDFEKPIDAQRLFDWHHILTGSCLQGRKEFCQNNGIDLNSQYTVNEFIELTKNKYGGDIIKMLRR